MSIIVTILISIGITFFIIAEILDRMDKGGKYGVH